MNIMYNRNLLVTEWIDLSGMVIINARLQIPFRINRKLCRFSLLTGLAGRRCFEGGLQLGVIHYEEFGYRTGTAWSGRE